MTFDPARALVPKEVEVQQVWGRQLRSVDSIDPAKQLVVVQVAMAESLRANVGPTVVPSPVAQHGRPGGLLLHLVIPFLGEDSVELFRFGVHCRVQSIASFAAALTFGSG